MLMWDKWISDQILTVRGSIVLSTWGRSGSRWKMRNGCGQGYEAWGAQESELTNRGFYKCEKVSV